MKTHVLGKQRAMLGVRENGDGSSYTHYRRVLESVAYAF
jgi:hypothetical protein